MRTNKRVFEVIRGGLDNCEARPDRQGGSQSKNMVRATSFAAIDRSTPKTRRSILHKLFS